MSESVVWRTWRSLLLIAVLLLAAVVLGVVIFQPGIILHVRLEPRDLTSSFFARVGLYATLLLTSALATRALLRTPTTGAPSPARGLRLRSHGVRPECPMCRDQLGPADLSAGVVRCPTCEVAHHGECWREHGGCATLACGRSPQERERARARVGGA